LSKLLTKATSQLPAMITAAEQAERLSATVRDVRAKDRGLL
jgi:hypothetical protein